MAAPRSSTGARTGRSKRGKVAVGDARVNRSDLEGLRRAWRRGELVLCLGAGVSMPFGIPSWRALVLELLFDQAEETKRLGTMWPHYRRALASWMTEYFDYDPLVLARMVERDLGKRLRVRKRESSKVFMQRLHECLYANFRWPKGRTTLRAIAQLIRKRRGPAGISAVVTFNFDDVLERELVKLGVRHQSIVSPARHGGAPLPIIHAHGFVPFDGELARRDLIFTEPDYHRLTESVFHWSLAEVVERLRKNTLLFIGLSMSDPSLRRLLDASRNSDIPPHWQIQKRHAVRDEDLPNVMLDVERRARRYAELIGEGFDEYKKPDALAEAIGAAVRQADTYDRQVFESMGVKTIWVDEFDHIRDVIDAIAT